MAMMAYARRVFEDDFVVVYEFGETRTTGPVGEFVVSKSDASEWHVFAEPLYRRWAEVTYVKAAKQFLESGEWPPGVAHNS